MKVSTYEQGNICIEPERATTSVGYFQMREGGVGVCQSRRTPVPERAPTARDQTSCPSTRTLNTRSVPGLNTTYLCQFDCLASPPDKLYWHIETDVQRLLAVVSPEFFPVEFDSLSVLLRQNGFGELTGHLRY